MTPGESDKSKDVLYALFVLRIEQTRARILVILIATKVQNYSFNLLQAASRAGPTVANAKKHQIRKALFVLCCCASISCWRAPRRSGESIGGVSVARQQIDRTHRHGAGGRRQRRLNADHGATSSGLAPSSSNGPAIVKATHIARKIPFGVHLRDASRPNATSYATYPNAL